MGQTNYLKILWIVLYLFFAAISCIVTEESIHLSFPTYSVPMCWIITIGFYIIASLGGSLLIDSFARKPIISFIDVKRHRTACLTIGALILLFFWLVFSMPTNTHTFLYHNQIDKIISEDITSTNNYLNQLKVAKVTEEKIALEQGKVSNEVHAKALELYEEIKNAIVPGDGPKAAEIRNSLKDLLHTTSFEKLSYNGGTSKAERERLCDLYRAKIEGMLKVRLAEIRDNYINLDKMRPVYVAEATTREDNIKAWEAARQQGKVDVSDADNIRDLQLRLSDGYATIKNYKDFVVFSDDADRTRYTAPVQATRIERLISVLDTWWDFLTGKFGANFAMIFCIFIAVLVDLAAFIFFYLAQK